MIDKIGSTEDLTVKINRFDIDQCVGPILVIASQVFHLQLVICQGDLVIIWAAIEQHRIGPVATIQCVVSMVSTKRVAAGSTDGGFNDASWCDGQIAGLARDIGGIDLGVGCIGGPKINQLIGGEAAEIHGVEATTIHQGVCGGGNQALQFMEDSAGTGLDVGVKAVGCVSGKCVADSVSLTAVNLVQSDPVHHHGGA